MGSPSSSPASPGSPKSTTSILTPTRKVQALLAQFSDSDSEDNVRAPPSKSQIDTIFETGTRIEQNGEAEPPNVATEDEEDDDVLIPRRAATARQANTIADREAPRHGDAAASQTSAEAARQDIDKLFSSSDEDVPAPSTRKSRMSDKSRSRSASPLFFPSPKDSKLKFLALVEKHRKERKDKEAEEAARRALQEQSLKAQEPQHRKPRGSSPADDTEEDSDLSEGAGSKKLSTQARPTRKASKKALEEMNRETQRISRNMQLAHQARTKKKITKDSLLARFNFPVAAPSNDNLPATSSSQAPSEDEAAKADDTPPTSPIDAIDVTKIDKGKGRALSLEPPHQLPQAYQQIASDLDIVTEQPMKPTVKPATGPMPPKTSTLTTIWSDNDDSDSDLEVVTSKADTRKYAAFEHLRVKKAKEAPSHIALRSLANLHAEDRRRVINAAGVEASLRNAARLQARQERQQRIEELKAKGVIIQTVEERDQEQQEVEDLLERARQEASEIQKREKAAAKKDGNYVKDNLDDGDDSDDESFAADLADDDDGESDVDEEDDDQEEIDHADALEEGEDGLLDNEAGEAAAAETTELEHAAPEDGDGQSDFSAEELPPPTNPTLRKSRQSRIVSDDEDEAAEELEKSPQLPESAKTPQSLTRSAKKQIPGLHMSEDLPIGLTQAFAATMADSQSQDLPMTQEQDSLQMTADLPSPNIAMVPKLYRLDSIDMISDSQPASQTQPLNINLSFSQSQMVPQSPITQSLAHGLDATPSQPYFEPTQDGGYVMSPFMGNRFAPETPQQPGPHSTLETVILPEDVQESPIVQRKARLMRGRANSNDSEEDSIPAKDATAFDVMQLAAAKKSRAAFVKDKSRAREAVDEAAEESEDEYAGLGGASDDELNDEENDEDRKMIDEDTRVGAGDEAKLAKFYADKERQQDEAAVSKLLKDITTGGLRRKRGQDDLDLSDEEDAMARRRQAKRREFAKMRQELLKDEAVGKIAEDKKKQAFLRSIEDRRDSDDENDFDRPETQPEEDSQLNDSHVTLPVAAATQQTASGISLPLTSTVLSKLNQAKTSSSSRRGGMPLNKRPGTLAEIRESVSFLIEEPDSQANVVDLGLSDSEDDPEAYVDLDRHLRAADADENAGDADDLGDFIVDDDGQANIDDSFKFKKPALPTAEPRAPFSERRTKDGNHVVNRISILRQSSSSSAGSSNTKMAFLTTTSSASSSFTRVPNLLRQATTNSSLGSMAGRDENVSATGVTTNKTERGKVSEDKEFVRKGTGGRRNAVNYRPTVREEKMSQRAGVAKKSALKGKGKKGGFLGGLFGGGSWA